jgi:hypothetical protein
LAVSVTDTDRANGGQVNTRNAYPARVALLESRHAARRVHRRISRDPDLRAAARKEVSEQQQRAKRALAGKEGADFFDYLTALCEHAPPEEGAAMKLAEESTKTRDVCGECGRKLALEEPAYRGITYAGMAAMVGKLRYENAMLCAGCAPSYLVESRPGPDRYGRYVFVHEPCGVCGRVTVFRTTRGVWRRNRHVFCCERCRWAHYNGIRNSRCARQREKVCEVCGEPFTATRRDAKTCSAACKQKAYRTQAKQAKGAT